MHVHIELWRPSVASAHSNAMSGSERAFVIVAQPICVALYVAVTQAVFGVLWTQHAVYHVIVAYAMWLAHAGAHGCGLVSWAFWRRVHVAGHHGFYAGNFLRDYTPNAEDPDNAADTLAYVSHATVGWFVARLVAGELAWRHAIVVFVGMALFAALENWMHVQAHRQTCHAALRGRWLGAFARCHAAHHAAHRQGNFAITALWIDWLSGRLI